VGEAAVFGAGCWSSKLVAVSVSGTGEQIIRYGLARHLAEAIEGCCQAKGDLDIHKEIERVMIEDFCEPCRSRGELEANAGAIILAREDDEAKVRLYCAFTTESMAIGYASPAENRPKAKVLRQSIDPTRSTVCIVAISV